MSRIEPKKAFTLFELMIVVVIIGVVYALMIQNFNFGQMKKENISLSNLPKYLRDNFSKSKEKVTFRCMDECSVCKIFMGGKSMQEMESFFEKYSSPEVYKLINGDLERIEFFDYVENQKRINVCFEYNLYPNKSTDKMVLGYDDKFYMYDNFFTPTKEFKQLGDAKDFWKESIENAKRD